MAIYIGDKPLSARYAGGRKVTNIFRGDTKLWPAEEPVNPYLTFSSPQNFTLKVYNGAKHWDGILEFSTDAASWLLWDGSSTLHSSEGLLLLRGTGNSVITGTSESYRWVLTGSNIRCDGNIETLLDFETVLRGQHPQMAPYCYRYLFRGCAALISAPALSAEALSAYCYSYMFRGCSALTSPPALPAKSLANYCYSYMFCDCAALTSAPALPATTLAVDCYSNMFDSCKSLTSAPALPAATLADYCYRYMFSGCVALASAPALPASTLTAYCYYSMFQGCAALTSAPALPASALATYCCAYMFQNCTALTSVPALPVRTLADSCYRYMFSGCSSLRLSATQTETYQYEYRIPASGSGTALSNSLTSMFNNTGGSFRGTPDINTTYYTDHEPVV